VNSVHRHHREDRQLSGNVPCPRQQPRSGGSPDLLEILTRPSGPTLTELSGDEQSVAQAQARRARLLVVASQLKQMRHAVEIAGSNMYAAGTADGGLFDDDRRLYDWFTAQLADDASLSQATGERAREVDTLADAAVRRRLLALQERERESRELAHEQERRTTEDAQRRRDRINFAQAAVVGAVLLALAAIQSFDYKKVVPEPGRPAVIAMLTALAVWLSVLTLLLTGPRRPLVRWLNALTFGLLTGTTAWVLASWIADARSHQLASSAVTAVISLVTGALGTAGAAIFLWVRRPRTVVRAGSTLTASPG
jgi:hypothetical protein